MQEPKLVSAQVVLRAGSGRPLDGKAAITTDQLESFAPAPEAVVQVQRVFREAAFEVGPMVGNSFSIAAPASTFERVFKTRLTMPPRTLELPLRALPNNVARLVEAVTFTPPPDFGPTGYHV